MAMYLEIVLRLVLRLGATLNLVPYYLALQTRFTYFSLTRLVANKSLYPYLYSIK